MDSMQKAESPIPWLDGFIQFFYSFIQLFPCGHKQPPCYLMKIQAFSLGETGRSNGWRSTQVRRHCSPDATKNASTGKRWNWRTVAR